LTQESYACSAYLVEEAECTGKEVWVATELVQNPLYCVRPKSQKGVPAKETVCTEEAVCTEKTVCTEETVSTQELCTPWRLCPPRRLCLPRRLHPARSHVHTLSLLHGATALGH
jgi:hypothetical protein